MSIPSCWTHTDLTIIECKQSLKQSPGFVLLFREQPLNRLDHFVTFVYTANTFLISLKEENGTYFVSKLDFVGFNKQFFTTGFTFIRFKDIFHLSTPIKRFLFYFVASGSLYMLLPKWWQDVLDRTTKDAIFVVLSK